MERLEDLNLLDLKIYQDDELYCFTSDAVLLSKFTRVKKGDVVADFCSGSGIVGLHLYGLNANVIKSVTLFEMQKSLFDLSVKSVEHNKLTDKFKVINSRVQDIGSEYNGKFSLITCNPPYEKQGSGAVNEKECIAVCRAEIALNLGDLIFAVSKALKFGGRFNMVHRADRLVDIITIMRKNNIEPKRLQFVSSSNKKPYLLLIEGVKGGKSGISIENNITN